MGWPNKVFVATTAGGVYYTENFGGPGGGQPVWAAVNTGLAALDCNYFFLDPFDDTRQYVMTFTGQVIYRRENGGAWVEIFSTAAARTLSGLAVLHLTSLWPDRSVAGRLWAFGGWTVDDLAGYQTTNVFVSQDYGATWTALGMDTYLPLVYTIGNAIGEGDLIVCARNVTPGGQGQLRYSTNGGASFGADNAGMSNSTWTPEVLYHGADGVFYPTTSYTRGGRMNFFNADGTFDSPTALAGMVENENRPAYPGSMRVLANPNHMILNCRGVLYKTEDFWATAAALPSPQYAISWAGFPRAQCHWNMDDDKGLVGVNQSGHKIAAYANDDPSAMTLLGGANANTAPYTDSIPSTAGYVCHYGIAALGLVGSVKVYAVAMPNVAEGADRGEPMAGDRSAWDAENYPGEHTNDTDSGPTAIHHTLGTGANQAAAGNHTHEGIGAHAASHQNGGADEISVAGLSGELADPQPPKSHEHTAAEIDSEESTDGYVLTADGSGGAVWEAPGGGAAAFTDLTDVPAAYASGDGGKLVRVKTTEDGLEFIAPPAGSGDVVGPASATDGHLAVFDGTTGKLLKDGGAVPSGGGSVTPEFVGVRATRVSVQSVNINTWTAILLDQESYDTSDFHSVTTATTRFTVPSGKAGYYSLKGHLLYDAAVASRLKYISIRLNGTDWLDVTTQGVATMSNQDLAMSATTDLYLGEGDYLELMAFISGATGNVKSAVFSIAMLGGGSSVFSGVRASKATHSINSNTWTPITFDIDDKFDTDNFHSPSTNPTRFTVPTGKAGYYSLKGLIRFNSAVAGYVKHVNFRINGTDLSDVDVYGMATIASQDIVISTTTDLYLNAGDYVELVGYISGANGSATVSLFSMAFLGT